MLKNEYVEIIQKQGLKEVVIHSAGADEDAQKVGYGLRRMEAINGLGAIGFKIDTEFDRGNTSVTRMIRTTETRVK